MRNHPLGPGVRRHGTGYEVRVNVRKMPFRTFFPLSTTPKEMQEWRKDEAAKRRTQFLTPQTGTFAADADRYLKAVAALITIKERIYHIGIWVAIFGTRRRASITSVDIRTQVEQWRLHGDPAPTPTDPLARRMLAANTINNRLRALSNVWTVLDGKQAPNPVRDVKFVPMPKLKARGLTDEVVYAILDAMPDTGRPIAGGTRPQVSSTKVRLRVIRFAGLAHKELMSLTPQDVNLTGRTVDVPARRKGKGNDGGMMPLSDEGVDALTQFAALNLWGPFSNAAMWKSFQRACLKLGLIGLTPYQFRHTYASEVYGRTGDLKATQMLMRHQDARTTLRYSKGAVPLALRAAMDKVQAGRVADAAVKKARAAAHEAQ